MNRRESIKAMVGLVLVPSVAVSASVVKDDGDTESTGHYVGNETGTELYYKDYDQSVTQSRGWLENEEGTCWGFVDKDNCVWEVSRSSVLNCMLMWNPRKDLTFGYFKAYPGTTPRLWLRSNRRSP